MSLVDFSDSAAPAHRRDRARRLDARCVRRLHRRVLHRWVEQPRRRAGRRRSRVGRPHPGRHRRRRQRQQHDAGRGPDVRGRPGQRAEGRRQPRLRDRRRRRRHGRAGGDHAAAPPGRTSAPPTTASANASAVADSLNALATDDCAVVAAADVGLLAVNPDVSNPRGDHDPGDGLGQPDRAGVSLPLDDRRQRDDGPRDRRRPAPHRRHPWHRRGHRHVARRTGRSEPHRDVRRRQRRRIRHQQQRQHHVRRQRPVGCPGQRRHHAARSRTSRPTPAWGIRTRSRRRRRHRA